MACHQNLMAGCSRHRILRLVAATALRPDHRYCLPSGQTTATACSYACWPGVRAKGVAACGCGPAKVQVGSTGCGPAKVPGTLDPRG